MGNFTAVQLSLASEDLELEPAKKHLQELESYAKEELERASRNITTKCKAYLDSRESEVCELERKILKLNQVIYERDKMISQQIEDSFNGYVKKIEKELKKEKKENLQKSQKITELEKLIKERDEEILKLKSLTDPARAMRRKGHCIRSGDVLHEHVSLEYKAFYLKRDLFIPLGISNTSDRIPELTRLLQLAYDCSKVEVLEFAKQELEKLFEMPQKIYSVDEMRQEIYQPWQSRQEALSLLLSLRKEKLTVPSHLVDKVTKCYESTIDEMKCAKINYEIKHIIEEVSHFAWKMVTLSPPVSFGTPTNLPLTDDLYDITDINNQLKNGPGHYRVEYRRPVLFFSPLGTVGEKGSVSIHPLIKDSSNTPQENLSIPIKKDIFKKSDSTSHTKKENHCPTIGVRGKHVHVQGTLSCNGDLQTENIVPWEKTGKDNESDKSFAGNKKPTEKDTDIMETEIAIQDGIDTCHGTEKNEVNGTKSLAEACSNGAENQTENNSSQKKEKNKKKKSGNQTKLKSDTSNDTSNTLPVSTTVDSNDHFTGEDFDKDDTELKEVVMLQDPIKKKASLKLHNTFNNNDPGLD